MSLEEELTAIGLSDKEVACYLALLQSGTRVTSFIARKTGLNRGTTYVALHSLLEKGLVIKNTKRKVQYFTAQEPSHLLQYLDWKEKEVQGHKERVQSVMTQLTALTNPLTTRPRVEFFEGVNGARTVFEDTLTSEEKTLRAFLSIGDVADFLGAEYFDDYTNRRIRAGYTLHAIRTLEKDKEAVARSDLARRYMTSKKDRREIRYVSEDLAFPITTYIYDHKLSIISSRSEDFALTIQSKELYEMQKKLFSLIWESLKQ